MKMAISTTMAIGIMSGLLFASPAVAGDAEEGEKDFRMCGTCHTVVEGQNRAGPSLFGIVGGAVAAADGYRYSPAMTAFGEDGKVWTEELIDQFLTNPRELVPGTRMALLGRGATEEQRANIIAYLKSVVDEDDDD